MKIILCLKNGSYSLLFRNSESFKAINKNFQNQLMLELTFNNVLDIFNHFGEFLTLYFLKVVVQNPKGSTSPYHEESLLKYAVVRILEDGLMS